MANFGAKILNNATAALAAQQTVIATTGNNIANVNTPGYVRRRAELEARIVSDSSTGVQIGSGVQVATLTRMADSYLEKLVREASGKLGASTGQVDVLQRLDSLFSLNGNSPTIGSSLNGFFDAVNDLAADPASIELRAQLIERGRDLVTTLQTTYNQVAQLQDEADNRIVSEVQETNALLTQIATLNGAISSVESGGSGAVAADERDRRSQLLEQLSGKISFNQLELADGTVTLSLSNGFTLVNGTNARQLSTSKFPSFAVPPLPASLSGGGLSFITFDYDPGAGVADFDLTQTLQAGDGLIGGLLKIRGYNAPTNTSPFQADGVLAQVATRIESVSRMLLGQVNTTYLGPDEDGGTAGHQPSSGDLFGVTPRQTDGVTPAVYALFDFNFAGVKDANANGLPDDLGAHAGVTSYTRLLQLGVTDPRRIAAARDSNAAVGATSFAPGDNQNMVAISAMQRANNLTFAVGGVASYSLTGSFADQYSETVTTVGSAVARAKSDQGVAESQLTAASQRLDETSGVSLDEEFTNLIKFQRAYQASARMIKIADELMQQIVTLI